MDLSSRERESSDRGCFLIHDCLLIQYLLKLMLSSICLQYMLMVDNVVQYEPPLQQSSGCVGSHTVALVWLSFCYGYNPSW